MKKILVFGLMFVPMFTFAAPDAGYITSAFDSIKTLLNTLAVLILALAVVFFLWNVAKFVMAGGDEEGKNEGRKGMISGIIGIAVMASLWGLVILLTGLFGVDTGGTALTGPGLSI